MHNSFILQQYICYTTLLNMFRAARCSSSGEPIVSPQPLVSSPSVSSRTVCRWRAESVRSPPVYRGWRYQRLWWYNLSSWGWAACCSKHVEERSVTYILLKNKRIVHSVGNLKKSMPPTCFGVCCTIFRVYFTYYSNITESLFLASNAMVSLKMV